MTIRKKSNQANASVNRNKNKDVAAFLKALATPHVADIWRRTRHCSRFADPADIRDRTGRERPTSHFDQILFGWQVKQLLFGRDLSVELAAQLPGPLRHLLEQLQLMEVQRRPDRLIESMLAIDAGIRDRLGVAIFSALADSPPPKGTTSFADVAAKLQGVTWLMKSWIPHAMMTMVMAPPGTGKSAFVLSIARSVILGRPFINGSYGPRAPSYVIWCDTEATNAITYDRLVKWGIPSDRLLLHSDDVYSAFSITRDIERLRELILRTKSPLVVIDSLRSAHGGDENSSGAMAQACHPLANLAQETGTAVVVVHHTKKLGEGQQVCMDSARGSNVGVALARSVIALTGQVQFSSGKVGPIFLRQQSARTI